MKYRSFTYLSTIWVVSPEIIALFRQSFTDFLSLKVAAAISRGTGDFLLAKEAVKKLRDFTALNILPLDSTLIESAIDIATDLQLRAGDAIYVALAHQLNIPLVSWDKEQLAKARSLILAYTPENCPFPSTDDTNR